MQSLDRKYKAILQQIAEGTQEYLSEKVHDRRMVIYPTQAYKTDTFGWEVDVLRLKTIPGRLQLWLDMFPNVGRPVLSVCYNSGDLDRVKKVAQAFTNHLHEKPDLAYRDLGPKGAGGQVLAEPLPQRFFGKALVESYQSKFFTFYLPDRVIVTSRSLSRKVHRLAVRLTRSIASALEANHLSVRNYSAIENRAKVVQHLARERSYKLAIVVKTRDGFTCQICGFNFAEAYGELGRGYAEAHHIVPLSNLRKGVKTRATDLICVCSNCHRMLHRMDGHLSDVNRLRQLVR